MIIPAFNGSKTIPFTILNVLGQNYPKDRYEVIVVDDGSTDNTLYVMKQIQLQFDHRDFSIFRNGAKSAASARNMAIKIAKGDIIAMLDQDVFVPKDFLKHVESVMSDGVAGIYGRMITDFKNFVEPLNSTTINAKYLTANCAYRKDALMDVGCFSEEFPFHRGDSELAYKLIEAGYKIEYAPNVVAYHPLKKFKLSSLRYTLDCVMIDPLLFKKHPKLASEDILRQVVPRITFEGTAVLTFILMVGVSSLYGVGVYASFVLLSSTFIFLSLVRSSFKGKPLNQRLLASAITMLMLVPMFVGRIIGSIKHRKLLI